MEEEKDHFCIKLFYFNTAHVCTDIKVTKITVLSLMQVNKTKVIE